MKKIQLIYIFFSSPPVPCLKCNDRPDMPAEWPVRKHFLTTKISYLHQQLLLPIFLMYFLSIFC